MTEIDKLIEFVEGRMSPAEFSDWLYNNKSAEATLSPEEDIPPYATPGNNLFLYLIGLNLRTPSSLLNAQDAISKFLSKKGVVHEKSKSFLMTYSALLRAQPKWLDIPDFYLQILVKEAREKEGKELDAWLRGAILDRFRYLKTPPKWIQSPQWLFEGERPLIFVGQLDISGLQHDSSQLYIFYDPDISRFITLSQFA